MEAVVQLYGGGSVVLAPLLEWETTLTGGVPCDSFYLKCPYHAAQAALLERAWRVTLQEKGTVLLRAVVDETEIVQNGAGQTLEISGRGLAALLLDNEAEAVTYTRPTLSELLRRHAAPYGLSWGMFSELQGQAEYSVSSGESQWRALEGFTRWVGGFVPRITAEGLLLPAAWKDDGRRFVIGAGTPLLELRWQDPALWCVFGSAGGRQSAPPEAAGGAHGVSGSGRLLPAGTVCARAQQQCGDALYGAISDRTLPGGGSAADGGAAGKTRSSAGKRDTHGAQ